MLNKINISMVVYDTEESDFNKVTLKTSQRLSNEIGTILSISKCHSEITRIKAINRFNNILDIYEKDKKWIVL
jgi:hypothetical protein